MRAIGSIEQVNLAQNGNQTNVNVLGSGPLNYHAIHLQNPDRIVLDFSGSPLKTSAQAHRQQSRSGARNPAGAVHAGSLAGGDRSAAAGAFTTSTRRIIQLPSHLSPRHRAAPAAEFRAARGNFEFDHDQSESPAASSGRNMRKRRRDRCPLRRRLCLRPDAEFFGAGDSGAGHSAVASEPAAVPQRAGEWLRRRQRPPPQPAAAPMPRCGTPASQPGRTAAERASQAPPQCGCTRDRERTAKYSGEPISVNLKDVDLRDFFRLIHEISGLNVVVDPSVKGNLTIVLDDVPWDQALDIVLHNNDLDKQLDGNVLRIATERHPAQGSGRKPRPGEGASGSRGYRDDHASCSATPRPPPWPRR